MKSQKDSQTVTPHGELIRDLIDGVKIQPSTIHSDDRGTLCEIHNNVWDYHEDPIEHIYYVTVRPRKIKGWVYHIGYDDRLMVIRGTARLVLWDGRQESETQGSVNEIFLSGVKPELITIPRMVVHAMQCVSAEDVLFVNMPSKPYDHKNPDKHRFSLDDAAVPYCFKDRLGQ